MDTITIGQIAVALTFVIGIISSISYLKTHLKEWISGSLKDNFDKIDKNLDAITKRVEEVDLQACKNYLVLFLADIEKGVPVDEIEKERFFEQEEHYYKLGGNSYIKKKIEALEKEGKL